MLSKEEIEESKKFLNDIVTYCDEYSTDENENIIDEEYDKYATKVNDAILYIKQLEQENKKLNKIIDEMAECLIGFTFSDKNDLERIFCDKEEVKKYFEEKAEEK